MHGSIHDSSEKWKDAKVTWIVQEEGFIQEIQLNKSNAMAKTVSSLDFQGQPFEQIHKPCV